ncbi:MAG: hypothetical protein ACR2ID_02740 [Chthoniobacterales bacterium]
MFDPSVSMDSSVATGSYTGSILLAPSSSNASGTSSLPTVQLNLQRTRRKRR